MASEMKPVDSISIRLMGAIEVQSIQIGVMAAFVPPGSLVELGAVAVTSVIVLIIRRKPHIAEMKSNVSCQHQHFTSADCLSRLDKFCSRRTNLQMHRRRHLSRVKTEQNRLNKQNREKLVDYLS